MGVSVLRLQFHVVVLTLDSGDLKECSMVRSGLGQGVPKPGSRSLRDRVREQTSRVNF